MVTGLGPCIGETMLFLTHPTRKYLNRIKSGMPTWEFVLAWLQFVLLLASICWVAVLQGPHLALVPFAVHSSLYYFFSQVSHANTASNSIGDTKEWVVAQVRTSRGDYAHASLLWTVLSLGLNTQAVHHCFPTVHWAHYPYIFHIILNAANEPYVPKSYASSFK